MAYKVYLADDEQSVLDVLSSFLRKDGFDVECFDNGDDVIKACEESLPDIVALDILMPGTDGLSVCAALRGSYPGLSIIIISSKDSPFDRVTGLTIGSDDYLSKPFLPIEFIARVRALLRRSYAASGTASAAENTAQRQVTNTAGPAHGEEKQPANASGSARGEEKQSANAYPADTQPVHKTISFGPLTIYKDKRTATLAGEHFPLTPNEFNFLTYLIEKEGAAVSREELLGHLWKVEWSEDSRMADDLVKRLRRKMNIRNTPVRIKTVWGYGFRIALEEANAGEKRCAAQ